MGVYVFECLHAPYVKVGHHLVTRGRPNAYYRVAGRGFEACVHPPELDGLLYMEHLRLAAWYPRLAPSDEREVHCRFADGRVGEFHPLAAREAILALLDARGARVSVRESARCRAVRWGMLQVRKARRRRRRAAA